jgi:hypothetical protein
VRLVAFGGSKPVPDAGDQAPDAGDPAPDAAFSHVH